MIDAFDVVRVINRTNSYYKILKTIKKDGDHNRFRRKSIHFTIMFLWAALENSIPYRLCKSVRGVAS